MRRAGQPPALTCQSLPWLALFATSVGLALSACPAWLARALPLTPEGVRRGQLWRLWTGHFVHYGSAHLWGDLLAFAVWAALVEGESRRVLARTLLIGAPLLAGAIALDCREVSEYRGLSGLDAALVVELVVLRGLGWGVTASGAGRGLGSWLTRQLGGSTLRALGVASLSLFALKTGYEFTVGHALLAPDLGPGVRLLPAAHLFGAVVGVWATVRWRKCLRLIRNLELRPGN